MYARPKVSPHVPMYVYMHKFRNVAKLEMMVKVCDELSFRR